ncbi:hypothetical protein [uncultured Vibrio sp.]|uniref:hypothetical protein n=1 Tax=uncultured Vibrio sp. TaxID=114054 RepID=UPI0025CD81BB|nr:hypothetical protein [uncultured Vibrio sp.]
MSRLNCLFLLCLLSFQTTANEYAVVSLNHDFPILRTSQVKMLYRGRLTSINGTRARLLDLPAVSNQREEFYIKVLGKNPSQMNAIWARQSFSGKAKAPFELKSENPEEVIQWLNKHKNGIAYLPVNNVTTDMNILYKTDN